MTIMFSLENLADAYRATGNVHKAASTLGISHSRAHRALTKAGLMKGVNKFSEADLLRVRAAYDEAAGGPVDLSSLAAALGRSKTVVARTAGQLGLTNPGRAKAPEHIVSLGLARDARFASSGHPRGFAGGVHSEEARVRIGQQSRDAWLVSKTFGIGHMAPDAIQKKSDLMVARNAMAKSENSYSRCKGGRRTDVGTMYFRSAWEANYGRYLNWLLARGEIDAWEYEPTTFWFEAIKRGVRSYKPDFLISEKGRSYYVEVKGWMDAKSKTKLQRMKKYHPSVEVRLVGEKQYNAIARSVARLIPNWEGTK